MSAMLGVLLDFLVCGRTICASCSGCSNRVVKTLQDDDAELWEDLSPCASPPLPKSPPVPLMVLVPSDSEDLYYDDVSALPGCDSRYLRGNGGMRSTPLKWGRHDLELQISVEDGADQFFSRPRLSQTPKRFFASKEDDSEFTGCDGSSYSSSYRKLLLPPPKTARVHLRSWETDSSDNTVQTMNCSLASGFHHILD
jgi:hypothetical protein